MSQWVCVESVSHRALAAMLADLLCEHGIQARVHGDDCGGVDPALAWVRGVDVMVPADRETKARQLLEAYYAANLAADDA